MAFTIPIKVLVDADTTGLRRALGPELESFQRSISQRAASVPPPRAAALARKTLGEAEGNYTGQINEAQRRGVIDARTGAQLRGAVKAMFDDMRTLLSQEISRQGGGLLGPNGRPLGTVRPGTQRQVQTGAAAGTAAQAAQLTAYQQTQRVAAQLAVARQAAKTPIAAQAAAVAQQVNAARTAASAASAAAAGNTAVAQTAAQLAAANRAAIAAAAARRLQGKVDYLDATSGLIPAEGLVARAQRTRNLLIDTVATRATTGTDVAAEVENKVLKEQHNAQVRRQVAIERSRTGTIQDTAAADLAVLNAKRQERSLTLAQFRDAGGMQQGTLTQRALAWTRQRQSGRIENPLDQQTFGQLAASRAVTTASFGLTGGLLYGALSFGGDILRESTQLQQELAIIRTQFELVDQTAAGITFAEFRQQIQDTAIDTGVAADEVAKVQRQLAGAFASDEGTPNFVKAASEGRVALQYSQVSGLPQQEITDSLTAVSLAFRDAADVPLPFEDILDTITDLENRFGVLGPEILKFTADLAPLAAQLGLTQQQLAGLGAVAQQASGKSGAVLAEQLGRILPSLADKKSDIVELLEASEATAAAAPRISEAFARGQADDVLRVLIEQYGKLDGVQKQTLASLVGGRREAATFYALLDRGPQTLAALDGKAGDSNGAFEKRWRSYQETVTYAVTTMRRSIEEFGQLLFEAGIGDALVAAADAAKLFGSAASGLLVVIRELNGALGGLPAKAAGLYALYRLFAAGGPKLLNLFPMLAGGLRGGNGSFTGAGGIGSLYRTSPMLDPAGNRIGTNFALRPSIQRAERSAIFSRFLNRGPAPLPGSGLDPRGAIIAGTGTTVAGIGATIAPIAATMAATYALNKLQEVRADLDANDEKVRTEIQAAIEKGMSRKDIFDKFLKDTPTRKIQGGFEANAIVEKNKPGITDNISRGVRGFQVNNLNLAEYGQAFADDPLSLGLFGETRAERERRIIAEELARAEAPFVQAKLKAFADLTGKRAKQLRDALSPDVLKDAFDNSDYTADQREAIAKAFDFQTGATGGAPGRGKFKTGDVTIREIRALLKKIGENPKDETLQEVARFITDNVTLPPDLRDLLTEVVLEFQEDGEKGKAALAAAERAITQQSVAGTFEERLKRRQGAYDLGTGTLAPIVSLIATRLKNRRAEVARRTADGLLDEAAKVQDEADQLQAQAASVTVDTAEAARTLTERIDSVLGRSSGVQGAKRNYVGYKVAYDKIRSDVETSAGERAKAAIDLLEAQRKVFEEELAQAASPAEIDAVVDRQIAQQRDPGIRNDIVSGQLAVGENSIAVQTLSEYLDLSIEDTRAIIANAITGAGGLNESILNTTLAKRREQLQAIIDTASSGPRAKAVADLAQVDAAIAALGGVSVVDPGAGADEAAEKAEKIRKQKQADVELQIRQIGTKDPVEKAKLEVQRAELQLANADPGEETEQAVLAVVQANQNLADTVRSEAAAIRKAGYDLRRIHASGDPVAQAAIDAEAARDELANAETEAERRQAMVSIAQADEAQRQAGLQVVNARGSYLAAMLSGDSVAQARQELSNANEALNQARGQADRYAALQRIWEAQQNLRESLLDVFIAQKDLAIAVAEGAGDSVEVARLQLEQAQERLRSAQQAGVRGAQLDRLRAGVVSAQSNLTQASRSDRINDLEFLYEMDRITANEFIKSLKAELAQIPITNKAARQEIERRIKALRDEMSGDLSMNIPDEIKIPTLYEVRRLNQVAAQNNSSSQSYVDARNIQIILNESDDPQYILDLLVAQLNSPARTGAAGPSTASFYI